MAEQKKETDEKTDLQDQGIEDFDAKSFLEGMGNTDKLKNEEEESGKKDEGDKGDEGEDLTPEQKQAAADEAARLETEGANLDPYWSEFRKGYEGIELPKELSENKDLTEPEKAAMLIKLIKEQTSEVESDDPFVKNYLDAKSKEGFNHQEWMKANAQTASIIDMKDDTLLKAIYTKRNKDQKLDWTEQQIDDHISKMNPIDRNEKANNFRAMIAEEQGRYAEKAIQANLEEMEKQLPGVQKGSSELITAFVDKIKPQKTIGGFRFEDADRVAFIEGLPKFTEKKIVEYQGEKQILSQADIVLSDILSDPEATLLMLPYLHLVKNGKIEGFSTKIVNAVKKKTIDTLDRSTERQKGQIVDTDFDAEEFKKE